MRIRLEPSDEFTHELGPEPTFNESMYFNWFDPAARPAAAAGSRESIGGWVRLGNRANEGRGEMSVCLYLPAEASEPSSSAPDGASGIEGAPDGGATIDGEGDVAVQRARRWGPVGFMFQRPQMSTNDAFDAAGLSFEVVEPFEHVRVAYRGPVLLLADPMQMIDPRAAFTSNPTVEAVIELAYLRVSDPFGGEPEDSHERDGEEFAKGHYEQLGRAVGTVRVGDRAWVIDGFGLRDHSWGPRTWQAPWYYRWLTANFGPDLGFMGSRIARKDRDGTRAGFVWTGGANGRGIELVDDVRITTDWSHDHHHLGVHARLTTVRGDSFEVTGRVLSYIPLRNRRDGLTTRIGEGLTEWVLPDGRVGYGMSEYLDQIVEGLPVGSDE